MTALFLVPERTGPALVNPAGCIVHGIDAVADAINQTVRVTVPAGSPTAGVRTGATLIGHDFNRCLAVLDRITLNWHPLVDTATCARLLGLTPELDELRRLFGTLNGIAGDVAAMSAVWEYFRALPCAFTETQIGGMHVRMNAEGVRFRPDTARSMRANCMASRLSVVMDIGSTFGIDPAWLVTDKLLAAWVLAKHGICLESVSLHSLERLRAVATEPTLFDVFRARDEIAAFNQFDGLLEKLEKSGGTIRPLLVNAACSTGRAGPDLSNEAGLNIQGLRRSSVRRVNIRSGVTPARPQTEFCAVDLSQVEARAGAWLANETRLLEAFRTQPDVYSWFGAQLAATSGNVGADVARMLGKQAILGKNYGIGLELFEEKVLLVEPSIPRSAIHRVFTFYDEQFPRIAAARAELHAAFVNTVVSGQPSQWSAIGLGGNAMCVTVMLPTGRPLFYRSIAVLEGTPWATHRLGASKRRDDEVTGTDGVHRKAVTANRLFENVVQALCRDLLFHQMLQLERDGLKLAFHVHDECVATVPACTCSTLDGAHDGRCTWRRGVELMERVMSTVPPTLPNLQGLPVRAQARLTVRRTYA